MRFIAFFALAGVVSGADSEMWNWRGKLRAGQTLEIKAVNGWIKAERATGPEVEVSVKKSGSRNDPKDVRIEVIEHDGGVTLCAVYPARSGDRPNECKPGKDGRMNVRDNDVNTDFTIRIPDGVLFNGRTVNGNVEATSLRADVVSRTVNGTVRISTSGSAEASTVNGNIEASIGRVAWTGEREFSTVNGSITLALPPDASARVRATSVTGGLSSDFPLTVRGWFVNRSINGTLGQGGRELKLSTVNGSIRLKQIGGRTI